MGTKEVCEFECSLRMDSSKGELNPEMSSFNNTIRPIRLKTLEPTRYNPKDLVCDRQRRLFTLESK
jgi:hypothetical protein